MRSAANLVHELPWREQKKRLTRQALHTEARRLMLEAGPHSVTVDAICAAAGVSPRTFFNYFPSKAAAALGVPDLSISEEERARFLAAPSGSVVRDLCALVGNGLVQAGGGMSDRESVRELLRDRPELKPELFHWLGGVRRGFTEIAEERLSPADARRAVTLVMAALMETLEEDDPSGLSVADRMWKGVLALCAVVREPAEAAPGGALDDEVRGLQSA